MINRFCAFSLAAACLAGAAAAAPPRNLGAAVTLDGIPEPIALDTRDRLADYLQARPASVLGFSPQEQLLIRSRFGDTEQLHVVALAGGARRQLTFGPDPVACAAFSPDPQRGALVYLKDRDGDASFQLYYQRLAEPGARLLSEARSDNSAPVWSSSGHDLAFTSTANNGLSHDIMVIDPESGALPHLVVAGDNADWRALDWAADDHLLLVLKTVSRSESHLYLVDLANGQRRELDPTATPASIPDARLARDGQGVYYISDAYGEFSQLRYINIFTGQKAAMSDSIRADTVELALSRDGRYLAFTSNDGSSDRLNLVDLVAHQDLTPPRLPFAGIMRGLSFDADARRLAFSLASPAQPGDAFVLDIATNSLAAWTHSETGPVDTAKFITPRLVHVPTFDRDGMRAREIPTYVYEPAAAGRHPVLIALEWGPERQFRPDFDPWIQYLVNEQGFAVVAPNLRGAPGYGKSYVAAGMGPAREDAIKDIGALLVWVRAQRDLDAPRLYVSGRGYGATLALAALVNYSDRVRGAVALSGISDLVEWLGGSGTAVQAQRRAQWGDERDLQTRAALRRLSPLTNVDRITRPLLVAHGKNDREVPAEQSDELVAAARSHNVAVWYLVANDQGHELAGKGAHDAFLRTFAQFLASQP
ncbi:MAG: prolyl oligopeptidase family serine peptidase [Steroidobacterales bacterium]